MPRPLTSKTEALEAYSNVKKAKPLQHAENIKRCLHYIHQNPFKAHLERKQGGWKFSSFPDYAGQRAGRLCNQDLLFNLTGYNQASLLKESADNITATDLF